MFIQPHYHIAILKSFSDYIGESGVVFGDRNARAMLQKMARSYSKESNYIVIFGRVDDSNAERIYFHGQEVHAVQNEDNVSYICITNGFIEEIKEGDTGFYLAPAGN